VRAGAAKEVSLYRDAVKLGFRHLVESDNFITNRTLIEMFQLLKGRSGGFRSTPSTALRNEMMQDMIYVPPQDLREIEIQMSALERFVNDDALRDLDPLIKMALIECLLLEAFSVAPPTEAVLPSPTQGQPRPRLPRPCPH